MGAELKQLVEPKIPICNRVSMSRQPSSSNLSRKNSIQRYFKVVATTALLANNIFCSTHCVTHIAALEAGNCIG